MRNASVAVNFLGDSPARAFEAGNQVNGHYPCQCGIDIRLCKTHANFIQPKYLSIWERNAILNKSDRWLLRRSGELSVFDNMDVSIHSSLLLKGNSTGIYFPALSSNRG